MHAQLVSWMSHDQERAGSCFRRSAVFHGHRITLTSKQMNVPLANQLVHSLHKGLPAEALAGIDRVLSQAAPKVVVVS